MSSKLWFLQHRGWKVVIFAEKETTYNRLPVTWGRQHNFTQLAFVEAEWRERRETWQQLWNEKIEKWRKWLKWAINLSHEGKKYFNWNRDWKFGFERGWKRLGTIVLTVLMNKRVLSFMIRKCFLSSFVQFFDIITHWEILKNYPKYTALKYINKFWTPYKITTTFLIGLYVSFYWSKEWHKVFFYKKQKTSYCVNQDGRKSSCQRCCLKCFAGCKGVLSIQTRIWKQPFILWSVSYEHNKLRKHALQLFIPVMSLNLGQLVLSYTFPILSPYLALKAQLHAIC